VVSLFRGELGRDDPQVPILNLRPCAQVFEFGHTNRTTEFTNLNEHSSRSHALLIVTVRGVDCSTGLRTTGEGGQWATWPEEPTPWETLGQP
jgi:hypothetical protein